MALENNLESVLKQVGFDVKEINVKLKQQEEKISEKPTVDTSNLVTKEELSSKLENVITNDGGEVDHLKVNNGIIPIDIGQGNTPTDAGGRILFKAVNDQEAPENGFVMEFGYNTAYKGQLFIGDGPNKPVAIGGWQGGEKLPYKKLVTEDALAPITEKVDGLANFMISKTQPDDKSKLWVDISNTDAPTLKYYDTESSSYVDVALETNTDNKLDLNQTVYYDGGSTSLKNYFSTSGIISSTNPNEVIAGLVACVSTLKSQLDEVKTRMTLLEQHKEVAVGGSQPSNGETIWIDTSVN